MQVKTTIKYHLKYLNNKNHQSFVDAERKGLSLTSGENADWSNLSVKQHEHSLK